MSVIKNLDKLPKDW